MRKADIPVRTFASEDEWHEYEEARGHLAGVPEHLFCPTCTREAGGNVFDEDHGVWQEVVRLGAVVEAHRDPTQTYVLTCGHTVI